jgi:hypothetical protein
MLRRSRLKAIFIFISTFSMTTGSQRLLSTMPAARTARLRKNVSASGVPPWLTPKSVISNVP